MSLLRVKFHFLIILVFIFSACGAQENFSSFKVDEGETDEINLLVELDNSKIYRGKAFTFKGLCIPEIVKVEILVDRWSIGTSEVIDGEFVIEYTFGHAENGRELEILGFDANGRVRASKVYTINVFEPEDVRGDINWNGALKLLSVPENIRYLDTKTKILEQAAELPEATVIGIPENPKIVKYRYRTGIGIKTSKHGFIEGVHILSVPEKYAGDWPQSRIDELNDKGLYFSKYVNDGLIVASRDPVIRQDQIKKILKDYGDDVDGPPLYKKSYMYSFRKRFPRNIEVEKELTEKNRKLWYELQKAAKEWGFLQSLQGEDLSKSLTYIALRTALTTAQNNGYADRFCAEFASEFVRQAFKRAGIGKFTGSPLVTNVNKELVKFGWIAWDPTKYYPPPGAVGMHTVGISPSHTYIIAGMPGGDQAGRDFGEGEDGYYVWDSSKYKKGVNIHKQTQKQINFMYNTGAFWLPPGIIPTRK